MRLHSWIEEEKPNFQTHEAVNLIPMKISERLRKAQKWMRSREIERENNEKAESERKRL